MKRHSVARLRMKALNFASGARYLYSNPGYTLAAQIVKRVSGQSLRELTEANIFNSFYARRAKSCDGAGLEPGPHQELLF